MDKELPVPGPDIQAIVQKTFPNNPIQSISVKQYSGETGVFSVIFQVKVDWKKVTMSPNNEEEHGKLGGKPPKSFVLKIPDVNVYLNLLKARDRAADCEKVEECYVKSGFQQRTHNKECDIYETLELLCHDSASNIPWDVATPKMHGKERAGQNDSGYLLMEDLIDSHRVPDFVTGLTAEQAFSVVKELAHLHALTFIKPNESDYCRQYLSSSKDFERYFSMLDGLADASDSNYLLQTFPDLFKFSKEEVNSLYKASTVMRYNMHGDYYPDSVLSHGDIWTNNCLVAEKGSADAENIQKIVLIDWQLTRIASAGEDISHMTSFSLSPSIRREYETKLLDCYYDELETCVKQWNHYPDILYSREDVTHTYKMCFLTNAFIIARLLPGVIYNRNNADQITAVERISANIEDALHTIKEF